MEQKRKKEAEITTLRRVQQSECRRLLSKFPYTFNTVGEKSQAPALLIMPQIYTAFKKNVDTWYWLGDMSSQRFVHKDQGYVVIIRLHVQHKDLPVHCMCTCSVKVMIWRKKRCIPYNNRSLKYLLDNN